MRLRIVAILLIAIGVVAMAGAWVASGWTPTVPADATSVVLARAALSGEVLPDPNPDANSDYMSMPPADQQCLQRITRPTGWLDLCWDAYRTPDGDPAKDYYSLRVYGSLSGSGTGVRWSAVRASLVPQWGQPADEVFDGWPNGLIEGPCSEMRAPSDSGTTDWVTVCGRTTGAFVGPFSYQVTWQCVGCVVPDRTNREVTLHYEVAVVEGSIPAWDIAANFGD